MRIPKRFKLHEATGPDAAGYAWESVLYTGDKLVASDGHVLAVVPVLPAGDRSGRDFPQLEPGDEGGQTVLLPLAVVKAAVQGKTGEGQIRVTDAPEGVYGSKAAFGRPGEGKPWTTTPLREGEFPDSWADHKALDDSSAPEGSAVVEIILDAERLVKAARAIGAAHGLRVRFYARDGCLDDRLPVLELRPAREPQGGPWAALGGQVVDDG